MAGEVFKLQGGREFDRSTGEAGGQRVVAQPRGLLITDNSTFEGAYYKGHFPSRQLSEIVFQVHKAERDGGFILHVIHISGKRMKALGVDGLSRGDSTEGMMGGKDPFSFIPFHQGADERAKPSQHLGAKLVAHEEGGRAWGSPFDAGHQG